MNVLGIGSLEILLILIVAFVFLGPERLIDVARFLGNAVKEGRKLASEMPRIIVEDDEIKVVDTRRDGKPSTASPFQKTREPEQKAESDSDGPVAFSRQNEPPLERPSDERGETR